MTRDQMALAAVEVDVSAIPEGVGKTFEWRGKPVFVRHRTQAEIDRERAVNHNELRHPQTDEERTPVDPKWVVTLGVCTHLGCVPIGAFALLDHVLDKYCLSFSERWRLWRLLLSLPRLTLRYRYALWLLP